MDFFKSLLNAIIFVFIIYGVYSALSASTNPGAVVENLAADPVATGGALVCYGYAYSSVTPAWQIDWLPPEGYLIFMVEDIPFPDGTDFLPLGIVMLAVMIVLRLTVLKNKPGIRQYLIAAGIIAGVLVISWIILKIVMYLLMLSCGMQLGFSEETVLAARATSIDAMTKAKFIWPMLVLSLFSGAVIMRTFFGGEKK